MAPFTSAHAAATVTKSTLVRSARVGRTTFDYTFTVTVANTTPALANAVATVTSSAPNVVVTKGTVSLGTLPANSTTTSSDTYILQVNLATPFDPSTLSVAVTGTALALVPDVVGDSQAAAASAITGAGLTVGATTSASSSTVPAGSVIGQEPAAGASVSAGSAVDLVISTGPAAVVVPNVVGQTQATASSAITAAGLVVGAVTTASSSLVAAGSVISESPSGGSSVAPGSAVSLVISSGPAEVSVPSVVGETQAGATAAITGVGLIVGTVATAASNTVPAGSVISQSPGAGTNVALGSAVNLVISSGPAEVSVPSVVGETQAAATSTLSGVGLDVGGVTQASSSTVPAGSVISQNPAAGVSVAVGSPVSLVISSGPAQVSVPNVVGDTQAAATDALTSAGLVLGAVTTASSSTVPAGSVISQAPTAGTSVSVGSAVSLVVSSGAAQVSVPGVVGSTQSAAVTAITSAGLVVGTISTAASSTVAAGTVISQSPNAGSIVVVGSAVDLTVSSGPAMLSVPNVVGLTQSAATSALTSAGLVVGATSTQNSGTVAAGLVISQSPAAGSGVSPGAAVDLVVSLGPAGASPSSLRLALSQLIVGAGDPLTISAQVLDSGGNPISSPPSIDYTITFDATGTAGTIPSVNGSQIVMGTDTRGSFRLSGTVHGTSVTASVTFTVIQNDSQSANSGLYATFSAAQSSLINNLALIRGALGAGNPDPSVIANASAAITAAAATVNPVAMAFSTAYDPDSGFTPTAAKLDAHGIHATAADTVYGNLSSQLQAKLQQITALLDSPSADATANTDTLTQYVTDLQGIVASLEAPQNAPSVYGVVKYDAQISNMLARDVPATFLAIAKMLNTELQAQGLVAQARSPADFYAQLASLRARRLAGGSSPAGMYGSERQSQFLFDLMLDQFGDVGGLIQKIYGDYLDQIERMAIIMGAKDLLDAVLDQSIIVSGFDTPDIFPPYAYDEPGSIMELTNTSVAEMQGADVYLIGGDAIAALTAAGKSLKPPDELHSISDLYDWLKGIVDALQGVQDAYDKAHQEPSRITSGDFWEYGDCAATLDVCTQLIYDNGFTNVSGGSVSFTVLVFIRTSGPHPSYGSALEDFAPST